MTCGVFDIMHRGHLYYLEDARRLGTVLIVGVDTDELVKKNKGNGRPILSFDERVSLVAALESVDLVFANDDYSNSVIGIKPHILVISPTTVPIEERDDLQQFKDIGIRIKAVKSRSSLHSTEIIAKIKSL